ncbi:MAG: transcription antitermination factor NusB [Fusobacterium perfoetens]|uniref:transcription antitermination factor NusB n=1 Tax=Fusobacterium perfoetens TaxID=852 RepID=UPI0023F0F8AA|nr:transcription antitermination factor NusB [Fusobacterium perfoetens]MCI6152807.1 transcription antitermination factor NusB [Fusobacterium perfoetens]MDY3236701.1 transcription antitermination factor NusB [Fusobacterium perfoetens]
MTRKAAREQLFKLIFEAELKETSLNEIFNSFLKRVSEEEIEISEESLNFIKKYALGISEHSDEILKKIENTMEGWSFERIGNIEKALLKGTVYELSYENTPKEIVINETVELAKKYGDTKSSEFLNGVLAKFV